MSIIDSEQEEFVCTVAKYFWKAISETFQSLLAGNFRVTVSSFIWRRKSEKLRIR